MRSRTDAPSILWHKEREDFLAECTLVDLVLGSALYERGGRVVHVYFPIDRFVSMLMAVDDRSALEVGWWGTRAYAGIH